MNIQKPGYLDVRLKVCPIELYFCENRLQWDFFFHIKTAKKITTVLCSILQFCSILQLYCHMVLSQLPRKNTSKKPAYVSSRLMVKFREVNIKG